MLALFLVVAALALPDDVVIPTPTEAIGMPGEQLWAVRDGKLWEKRGRGAWTHFATPTLTRPIVAVFADEISQFTVVTDDGLMHHFENGVFDSLWGLPSLPVGRAPLSLPLAVGALRPGLVAYSMRRDRALYYEDGRGQQFHWGDVGCTSLFVRHPRDDTRILFADPWIPPDWSREVCGPERGTVRLASIAASASVLFAISASGEMWTRFDDYDHNGGTPLFHYSYDPKAPVQTRAGTDPSSAVQVRQLPGHDWRAQPRIPLEGRARISRRIAIVQTGVGNDARALRVAGDDVNGVRGVYTKSILDAAWSFTPAAAADVDVDVDVDVDDGEWLAAHHSARVPVRAQKYTGALEGPRALGYISARVDDFSFHCSPFTLTLTIDGVDVPLTVHAVDAWTVFTHDNPVDDPAAPKLLKLTFMPPLDDGTLPAHVRRRLDELSRGELGKAFAFVGVANQRELVIQPLGYPVTAQRSRWQIVMRAPDVPLARRVVAIRPASHLAAMHAREPCEALHAVREQRRDISRRLALFSSLEVALPSALGVADAATIATTTRYTLEVTRWLTALELHVPAVAAAPSLAYGRWLQASRRDFDEVEATLDAECRSTK